MHSLPKSTSMFKVHSADVFDAIQHGWFHEGSYWLGGAAYGETPLVVECDKGKGEDDCDWADKHHGGHEEEVIECDGGCDSERKSKDEESECVCPHDKVEVPPDIGAERAVGCAMLDESEESERRIETR